MMPSNDRMMTPAECQEIAFGLVGMSWNLHRSDEHAGVAKAMETAALWARAAMLVSSYASARA